MSALPPLPTDPNISTQLRGWMTGMLTDSIAYDTLLTEQTAQLSDLRRPNILIDGWCEVGQGNAAALSLVPTYGKVDMWAAFASNAVVGAGSIDLSTPSGFGRGIIVNTATLTGAAARISIRQRIEGARTTLYSQTPLSFSMVVRSNTGFDFPARVIIRTPTVLNNFGALTTIYTSPDVTINGTVDVGRRYAFEGIPAAVTIPFTSLVNGLEIEIQFDTGPITSKRVIATAMQLVPGATLPFGTDIETAFPYKYTPPLSFTETLREVQRYYQKSFDYGNAPAQASGRSGAVVYQTLRAGANATGVYVPFMVPMRTSTPTMTYYNPDVATANARNLSLAADSGAVFTSFTGERGFFFTNPQVAGDAVGNNIAVHWTADARF